MVISLMTIIPVTAFEANAASYNADEVQAQTVSGQEIKIPNVWSARRSIESGKTYTISWLSGNTARLLTLSGNEPGWRDQTVIKGTSGMPYYFNASANANELWTTSRDGGWYWRNNSNNYYLCFNYTGAITLTHDTFRISGQPSKPKNDGTLSGWYTFKDVSTKNAVTGETRLYYSGDASDKVMSFYTRDNYWTAINTNGGLKKYATNTYMFQKQDLTVGIGIAGPSQVLYGGTVRYKFNMWDDLGSPNGASHLAVGSTAANANYSGYTYGTNRSVTWSTNNANIATIDANGVLTTKANGDVTITCRFKWTDNGVNYELVGSKRIHVMKADYEGTTLGMSAWVAVRHPGGKTSLPSTVYLIARAASSTANSVQSQPILNNNGRDKQVGSIWKNVQVPLDAQYAPYIRANVEGSAQWTLSNSYGNYKWKNGNDYLAWYYPWNGNAGDDNRVRTQGSVKTDGALLYTWYSFVKTNGANNGAMYSQTLNYGVETDEGIASGVWKRLHCDASGNWSKKQSGWNNDQYLTLYSQQTINVSLGVTPKNSTGLVGGTQQLTAKPSQNYRYNGGGNYMWVSSNPDVATVDESGKVTYVSEGTATITCYYYWTDELDGKLYCIYDTATVNVTGAYTINYDANGGSGNMASQTVAKGNSIKLNSCTFTGPGTQPKFMGWSTTPDGAIEYANGATIKPTSGMTLYAIWGYDVTFSSNDYYNGDNDGINICYTKTITVRRDGGTVISNQDFYNLAELNGKKGVNHANSDIVGWMTGRTGEIAYPANTGRLSLDGPITLHAQWQYDNTGNALLTNEKYPVTITCIGPIDGSYPAEPGVASGYNWHFVNPTTTNPIKTINGQGYTLSTKAEPWTFTTGANVIDPSIFSSPAFQHSINEGGTWGVAGKTVEGVTYTPRQYIALDDDFWNQLRDLFLSDPTRNYGIDEKDFDNYELVPYVVKAQHGTSQGWHVDCYLKSKTTVSYTYDVGLNATEYIITGGMPEGGTAKQGSFVAGIPAYPANITVKDSYGQEITFIGYETEDGDRYLYDKDAGKFYRDGHPGDYITGLTLNDNTTFTALWQTNTTTLVLRKSVVTANDSDEQPTAGQLFTFAVTINVGENAPAFNYTVYDASNNIVGETKTVDVKEDGENGAVTLTVKLGDGYRLVVKDVISGASYSISETPLPNYTLSYSGSTPLSGTLSGVTTVGAVNTYRVFAPVSDSTAVIDFGLPVDINVKYTVAGISAEKLSNASALSLDPVTLRSGVASASGKVITYTPTSILSDADTVYYAVETGANYKYASVKIIPAASVYYEDSFVTYTGSWSVLYDKVNNEVIENPAYYEEGSEDPYETHYKDLIAGLHQSDGGNVYGYDPAYGEYTNYSLGKAMTVTVAKGGDTATAEFTFTGTGFELYSATTSTQGGFKVSVYDADGKMVDTKKMISTKSYDSYWQIPVFENSKLPYGTYTVKIEVAYSPALDIVNPDYTRNNSVSFILDGVRIYNSKLNETYGDVYAKDGEYNAQYIEVRDQLIKAGSFNSTGDAVNGAVYIDGRPQRDAKGELVYNKDGYLAYDRKVTTSNVLDDYKNYGPKNEVYLAPGQGIAFKVEDMSNVESVQLGLKSASGEIVSAAVNGTPVAVGSSTEMYYKVSTSDGKVVITNNGTGIISVTNVKLTYKLGSTATTRIIADADLMQYAVKQILKTPAGAGLVPVSPTPAAPAVEPTANETQTTVKADLKQVIAKLDAMGKAQLVSKMMGELVAEILGGGVK